MAATHPSHRIRGPLNAWGLRALDGVFDRTLGDLKRRLLDGHPDRIVEFGSGPGTNTRYLRRGTTLVAVEPNAAMHRALRRAAADHDLTLELLASSAENVPVPDASVDAVVCTLVLCTVPDPAAAIAEAHRILRPGGQMLFVEHVVSPTAPRGIAATVQRVVRRPWRWLFEGCDVCRDTASLIGAHGFADVEIHQRILKPSVVPVAPIVWGTATR